MASLSSFTHLATFVLGSTAQTVVVPPLESALNMNLWRQNFVGWPYPTVNDEFYKPATLGTLVSIGASAGSERVNRLFFILSTHYQPAAALGWHLQIGGAFVIPYNGPHVSTLYLAVT